MYNAPCAEREELKEHNSRMQAELQDLREAAERKVASNLIEVRLGVNFKHNNMAS